MADVDSGLRDIAEIRSLMERSTKFLSLSGFAGVGAGVVALGGAWVARGILASEGVAVEEAASLTGISPEARSSLILLGLAVLALALAISWLFSLRIIRRKGGSVHPGVTRSMILALAVPVLVGALMTVLALTHGALWLVVPSMLIFYGLGLFSAGTFTVGGVRMLGILQILLGLAAAVMPQAAYGLWTSGFGVLHIVYGVLFFRKYRQ
jgi:hypothetical protein